MSNSDGPSKLERLIAEQERIDTERLRSLRKQYPEGAAAAPEKPRKRKRMIIGIVGGIAALALIGGGAWAWTANTGDAAAKNEAAATETPSPTSDPTAEPTPTPTETAEPEWDIDDPSSLQIVVNKQRPFDPIDWVPDDLVYPEVSNPTGEMLRTKAATALEKMYAASVEAGVPFTVVSGYRDYALQEQLYNNYVANDGAELADTYSARPGYSEHQTGLTADVSECEGCGLGVPFGQTPQGLWIAENGYRYGFIERYPEGQEATTGFTYEPWHLRYVGKKIATEMHKKDIKTLEEYFELDPAPTY